MHKAERLLTIEKILANEEVPSHEVLLNKLKSKGILCTQATLSRNLRQLGAIRRPDPSGGYKYVLPESSTGNTVKYDRLQVLPVITAMIEARGMILIRTLPGNANNAAIYIDNASRYEIAGTIAGDDTILIIPRDGITGQQIHTCLEMIMPGLHEQLQNR